MHMSPEELLSLAKKLLDWYWRFGAERDGRHQISGSWLNQLQCTFNLLASICSNLDRGKLNLAVWGPSQSGKSTLISTYVDLGSQPDGSDSALHWPGGEPARFVRNAETPEKTISLNPFNLRSDASGCISRFSLRSKVLVPAFPVRLSFNSNVQLMHALAAGYLTECKTQGENGKTVYWDADRFIDRLAATARGGAGSPQREAFEQVHEFADTLELLVRSREPRYANLAANDVWKKSLRRQLLDAPGLLRDNNNLRPFAADVLWDGHRSLTNVFDRLMDRQRALEQKWADKAIYCSLRTASHLLDIDSYKMLTADASESSAWNELKNSIRSLSWKDEGERILIGHDLPNNLVESDEDFGLFQALVRELTIPLRKEVIESRSPEFGKFLSGYDLLDFPGVALAHQDIETKLFDPTIGDNQEQLLTEVFKRGKTASIMAGYSRLLELDNFLVLARVGQFPAQPRQLVSGVDLHWQFADPDFSATNPKSETPPLPLNLVLTFFARLVKDVRDGGDHHGLDPVFRMVRSLGALADPRFATTFATTYQQFDEGSFNLDPAALERVQKAIKQDKSFQRQFESDTSIQSFEAMLTNNDGGTGFLFDTLAEQCDPDRKSALLQKRTDDCRRTLQDLVREALPPEDEGEKRRAKDFNQLLRAVADYITKPPPGESGWRAAARASYELRTLLAVEPEILDPLPTQSAQNQGTVGPYVEEQLQIWFRNRAEVSNLERFGLEDTAFRTRILGYFVDAVDTAALARWVVQEFGHIRKVRETLINRRFLAVAISNALLGFPTEKKHRAFDTKKNAKNRERGIDQLLGQMASAEAQDFEADYKSSPHLWSFIDPLFECLKARMTSATSQRPRQNGDEEISRIAEEFTAVARA